MNLSLRTLLLLAIALSFSSSTVAQSSAQLEYNEKKLVQARVAMRAEYTRPGRAEEINQLEGYKVGELTVEKFRDDWSYTTSSRLGIATIDGQNGLARYGIGSNPLTTHPEMVKSYIDILEDNEKTVLAGIGTTLDTDSMIFCTLVFENALLVENTCTGARFQRSEMLASPRNAF